MQSPYQPLAVPQASVYRASAPSSSSQACCPCCVEPACCSRVGACPCFCTGYTAAFSLGLAAIWLALPMLVTAMVVTDLFEVTMYGDGYLYLGMWQACGWFDSLYRMYGSYRCITYGADDLNAFAGAAAQFNALRALTLAGSALTLIAGILAAIRLARQQRSKPDSGCINTSTLLSAMLALASAGTAFGLSFPLNSAVDSVTSGQNEGMTSTTWGLSWIFLVVGVGLLTIGTALHLLAHCCYQCNVVSASEEEDEQPSLYAVNYPAAAIFAHPQPLHHSAAQPAVYYPAAAAIHYPTPQFVHQPSMSHIYQ